MNGGKESHLALCRTAGRGLIATGTTRISTRSLRLSRASRHQHLESAAVSGAYFDHAPLGMTLNLLGKRIRGGSMTGDG